MESKSNRRKDSVFTREEYRKDHIVVKPQREAKTEKLWKLRKAVYDLKDAARVWYETVVGVLAEMGGKKKQIGPNIICLEEERKNHWYYGDICG